MPSSTIVLGSGMAWAPPLNPALPKSLRPLPLLKVEQLLEMALVSIVTAAFCAKALPHRICALLFIEMLSSARIFPANEVVLPRVAEPMPEPPLTPSSQYTPIFALPLIT